MARSGIVTLLNAAAQRGQQTRKQSALLSRLRSFCRREEIVLQLECAGNSWVQQFWSLFSCRRGVLAFYEPQKWRSSCLEHKSLLPLCLPLSPSFSCKMASFAFYNGTFTLLYLLWRNAIWLISRKASGMSKIRKEGRTKESWNGMAWGEKMARMLKAITHPGENYTWKEGGEEKKRILLPH